MKLVTWEYESKSEETNATHIGPMAEEFHDAFDVGSSDEHINSINADGVALAAIQGLSAKLDEREERIDDLEAESDRKDERIDDLQAENEQLREQNAELEQRLAAIEDHLGLGDSGTTDRGVADD